jgi:hypothetical protein
MQTFLPYPSFEKSAKVLDYRRLGKQRVEAWQILNALRGTSRGRGWVNHPATKMWRGYETALIYYGIAMCEEWIRRGYKDTMLPRFKALLSNDDIIRKGPAPPWLGNKKFHRSHRSNLVRKLPEYYGPKWPNEEDNLPYVWPENNLPEYTL